VLSQHSELRNTDVFSRAFTLFPFDSALWAGGPSSVVFEHRRQRPPEFSVRTSHDQTLVGVAKLQHGAFAYSHLWQLTERNLAQMMVETCRQQGEFAYNTATGTSGYRRDSFPRFFLFA
jgi:hypothetical protein